MFNLPDLSSKCTDFDILLVIFMPVGGFYIVPQTVSFPVYPSLESDEEDHASKAKMKRKRNWDDTPWSPKGIVSYSLGLHGRATVLY